MEQNKKDTKRLVEVALFILTEVFTFLSLVFNIYDVKLGALERTGNGFQLIFEEYPQFLSEGLGDWLSFYNIFIIVALLVEDYVYTVTCKTETQKRVAEIICVCVNVILTFIYMINGFVAKLVIEAQATLYTVQTAAFIPFIIVLILAGIYFYVVTEVKEIRFGAQRATKGSEVSATDELVKYKKLLDDGVITQEEYDIKKKELLGL